MTAASEHGTIPRMVLAACEQYRDRIAIADGKRRLRFSDVADEMLKVGAALVERGVQPGDRVAVWAPNSAAWVTAALGLLSAGAWLVPVNTRYTPHEVQYLLDKTEARALLVTSGFMGIDPDQLDVTESADDWQKNVIHLPLPGESETESWVSFKASGTDQTFAELRARIADGSPDNVSDVMFTSGTTGKPKGVMLRHGTTLKAYETMNAGFGLKVGDAHLVVPPFFHCFGYKAGWMLDLMFGATCVPMAVLNADAAAQLIQDERITHISGPPTLFTTIIDHPRRDGFDLSSLRVAFLAATTIPERLVMRLHDELNIELVMTGYGLTENHAIGAFTRPATPLQLVSNTVGQVWPGIEARIVDDNDQDVPAGEPGEILLSGYALMSGYYHDQAATDAVMKDGWLHTGDIGSIDGDGYVRILGRNKDMYIVGGFNVAPAEVEETLLGLSYVAQVAVIGVPDERLGEVGAAYIVLRDGAEGDVSEVISFARERLANFKVPRQVRFVPSLTMNSTGKVVKAELRAAFAAEMKPLQ
jgi:HIP---CoA ligase